MKTIKKISAVLMLLVMLLAFAAPAYATEVTEPVAESAQSSSAEAADDAIADKAWSAALAIGLTAAVGAISMGLAISKSVEGISRQPEAEGSIRTSLMLGLVFVETAIIYALIVAILIVFVL